MRLLRLSFLTLAAVAAAIAAPAPAAAQQATHYQVDAQHSGATTVPGLSPPFARRWAVDLGRPTSYPVIADGRVYVVVSNGSDYGVRVVALLAADGRQLWERALGGSYYWGGIAYGDGRLYAVNGSGMVVALDPATGATQWAREMEGQYSFSSEPTFSGGRLFVTGSGSGGTLYALDAATGAVQWSAAAGNGDHTSPAVGDGRVFTAPVCDVHAVAADSGRELWHHNDGCSGGGGRTAVLFGGRLYARRPNDPGRVMDPGSGRLLDTFGSTTAPAFAGDVGVMITDGRVRGVNVPALTDRWSFADGTMTVAPIIVNDAVIAGSSNGKVVALDRASGRPLWEDQIGREVPAPDEHNVSSPLTGLAAGEGLLVVPANGLLVAYSGGGRGGADGGGGGGGDGGAQQTGAPVAGPPLPAGVPGRLTLSAGRTRLYLSERTRLRGRLSGVPKVAGRTVAIEADVWPFDGRYRLAERVRTDRRGRFGAIARPPRNIRIRARLVADRRVASTPVSLYADFPGRVKVLDAGGERPRVRLTLFAFRRAQIRRRPVFAYLADSRSEPYRLVARRAWQRKTRRSVTVEMPYPRGTLRREQAWVLCSPEPTPDAFGRPSEIERRCGAAELPRGQS